MKKFDGAFLDYSKWSVFFEDRFNYADINEMVYRPITDANPNTDGKWYLRPPYDPNYGWGAEQYIAPKVSLLSGGGLKLTATRITDPVLPRSIFVSSSNTYRDVYYETGMIRTSPLDALDTNHDFASGTEFSKGFRYGMFEIRAKLPSWDVPGVWPTIWMFSNRTEIDIMDNLKLHPARIIQTASVPWDGKPSNYLNNLNWTKLLNYTGPTPPEYNHFYYYYKGEIVSYRGAIYEAIRFSRPTIWGNYSHKDAIPNFNLASTYNTYTLVWNPTEICLFFNGYKVFSQTKAFTELSEDVPYLMIGMQMQSWTQPDVLETFMEIDYVRVYKPIGYVADSPTVVEDFNFRFHDETTYFNNLSSINRAVDEDLVVEKAESDLVLGHGGGKVYFRSDQNRLNNFYLDDTNAWSHGSLDWNVANVAGNIVQHPTEESLFYRGKLLNPKYNPNDPNNNNLYLNNQHSVFSFYYDTNNIWINENLGAAFSIKNVAGDIVVNPIDGKQIYYRNTNGTIFYFEKDGNGVWQHQSTISTLLNVEGDLVHSLSQTKKLYYKGKDNRLYNLYFDGSIWLNTPLGLVQNVAGDIIHSPIGLERLFYRGTNDEIYMFTFEAGTWVLQSLNFITYPKIPANVKGHLVHSPTSQSIYYIGYDNVLYCFYYNIDWYHFTLDSSITNVAFSKLCISASGKKIYYKGTDDKLHLFYFLNDRWFARSMQFDGSNNVAGNIVVNSNDKPFYIGIDGEVWTYNEKRSGNYDWAEEDISID